MPAPTLTPQEFVARWKKAVLKERSAYQQHFLDLCALIGHATPADADPTGQWFTFEAGTGKLSGGGGWADVWKKGYFALEYKGKYANLDKAYQQVLQYRESLLNPPLLAVCDIDSLVIHTNYTNTVKRIITLTLDDLLTPAGLQTLRDFFENPNAFKSERTTEDVTREAAAKFAKLAELLRRYGDDPQRVAHFLIRLLFCLFAEDVRLLPDNLFSRLIERTRKQPKAFATQLKQLFGAMATGGWFGSDEIVYFDGGLFDDDTALELDGEGMDILAQVSALDWSAVEPAIFGTLFERSLDPAKRAQLGAHYTSRDDILLIVEPVLMAPLRHRWAEVRRQAEALVARRDQASGGQSTRAHNELKALLTGFSGELTRVKVLDPACGSGNFLYVALKQLLDLEKAVITYSADVGVGSFFPLVSPEQLRGIEVNEYAHELASVTVWIGYIQWLRENGYGAPAQPILKPLDTIRRMDAILAFDEAGKPVEPAWPDADVVIGNPPFLGGSKLRRELGDGYVTAVWKLYESQVPGGADLVTYWFERARVLIEQGKVQRAGLLATNSIRGGFNRKVLERIKQSGDIFMAWADREWILDGAAVRVSMVGFDNGSESERVLDAKHVSAINADLTTAVNLATAKTLVENEDICFRSDEKGGPFDIDPETALHMISAPLNPNGRPNTDVVRPYVNGFDVTRRPRGQWIIDFGVDALEEEAALYEQPFEYVQRTVKPIREQVRNKREQALWWLHRRPAPDLRNALRNLRRFIATPAVAKHRLFVWFSGDTIPDHQLYVIAREDDYFFGVLHSRPHELWALRMGTSLEDRPRYTPTTTFETFPFPWPPGTEPQDDPRVQAIAAAAKRLVELRDNWLNPPGASEAELKKRTLTNLYNERPAWLKMAHEKLDKAVLDAYGWPHDLSDEQILERLLALNLARATTVSEDSPGG